MTVAFSHFGEVLDLSFTGCFTGIMSWIANEVAAKQMKKMGSERFRNLPWAPSR